MKKKNPIKKSDFFLFLIRIFPARVSLLFKEQQASTSAILATLAFIQTKSRILICSYYVETLMAQISLCIHPVLSIYLFFTTKTVLY